MALLGSAVRQWLFLHYLERTEHYTCLDVEVLLAFPVRCCLVDVLAEGYQGTVRRASLTESRVQIDFGRYLWVDQQLPVSEYDVCFDVPGLRAQWGEVNGPLSEDDVVLPVRLRNGDPPILEKHHIMKDRPTRPAYQQGNAHVDEDQGKRNPEYGYAYVEHGLENGQGSNYDEEHTPEGAAEKEGLHETPPRRL